MKIPEIKLEPIARTAEAKAVLGFQWADGKIGRRHKLGGEPDWIQAEDVPFCPTCEQEMTFYGQLDSIGDEIDLADCGMIYLFVCFDCFEVKAVLQSW